jgi:hypothetical protein
LLRERHQFGLLRLVQVAVDLEDDADSVEAAAGVGHAEEAAEVEVGLEAGADALHLDAALSGVVGEHFGGA